MTAKPNLFIIGAPKCGTSSLAYYLGEHPDIFMCQEKEPHYFNTDINFKRGFSRNIDEYLGLFSEARDEKIITEASVWYLYSQEAITNILQFNPEAKFVVMIRNPIDMAISLHRQLYDSGHESIADFQRAYSLQNDRNQGKYIPRRCSDNSILLYSNTCALGTQLKQAMNQIPQDQLHIIVFDDFVSNTQAEYQKVLQFLEISDDDRQDFPRINPASMPRSVIVRDLIFYTPDWVKFCMFALKKLLGIKRFNIFYTLRKWNTKMIKMSMETDPDSKQKLTKDFTLEINKLEKLLQRDFSHWKYD